jgi:predicted nuclease of predicted toxin-antitoxin system
VPGFRGATRAASGRRRGVKLLLDQNLSPRLVQRLADLYPEMDHIRNHGLARAGDETVWEYARRHEYIIVTKDTDFHQRSFLYGHPPKVIWLAVGNSSTEDVEGVLRREADRIRRFAADQEKSVLVLKAGT